MLTAGEEDGKRYWLIQNSWGADSGEAGFYRLVRGKRACGIDQLALHAKRELKKGKPGKKS